MSRLDELLAQLKAQNGGTKKEAKKSGAQKGRTRGNGTKLAGFKPMLTVAVKPIVAGDPVGVIVDRREERLGYSFTDNRKEVR